MVKRALLIGINRYRIPGADLRGCVNDVQNIQSLLVEKFDFPRSGIRSVTDFRATTARIRLEMEKLVANAKRGDVILLHYSGHGASVPDKNGDEADRQDEILCPTDLDWHDPLTDDWLRGLFDSVDEGVNVTVTMDCCHSGSNTRQIRDPNAEILSRFLPCPLDFSADASARGIQSTARSPRKSKVRKSLRDKNVVDVDIPEILISGCRDDQTSADARIDGTFNGAMTYSLVHALRNGPRKMTYRQLHAEMLVLLQGSDYAQVPQLEGRSSNLDHPFLDPY